MKKYYVSLLMAGFGVMLAGGQVLADELPSANLREELKSQITAETAQGIAAGMNQTSPEPTPTPNPLIINTGSGANLDTSSQQHNDTAVTNNNQATVDQGVNASANTGGNQANYNISIGGDAGVIRTGNASVYSQLQSQANTNQSGVQSNCPGAAGGGQVVNSGANTTVAGGSNANCTTTLTNGNGAVINQGVAGSANTGDNQAIGNISIGGRAGVIETGNASVGSMLVTKANYNVVLIGGNDGNGAPGTGANIYIINTGSNAAIDGRRSSNSSTTVDNSNQATIGQTAILTANTGDNTANGNINLNGDAGVIRTGNAVVSTTLAATGNHNQTAVLGSTGAAGAVGGNTDITNSGANLDVDASTEVNSEVEVNNTNEATVNQVVSITANTGRNTANGNIAFGGNAGVIETGDAIITTSVATDVNKNQTVIGDGLGAGTASTAGGSNELINSGSDVEVDFSTEVNSEVEVNNTNEATVTQTVTAEANTGNNSAIGNVGGSSISTGNATIHTEVVTNANNNYTFIIDSDVAGLELFKQFVEAFLGMTWEELVGGAGSTPGMGGPVLPGSSNIVNSGSNVTILNEQTQNRQVVVNNSNTATVNQSATASANTGGNSCIGNIGDCQITTGDATVWTRLVANVNNNFTFIASVTLPETPVEPEPEPETPAQPEVKAEQDKGIVLAAALPNTGGESFGLLGLGVLLLGAGLTTRKRAV